MSDSSIKFLDLSYYYTKHKSDIDVAVQDILSSGFFLNGPYLEKFEQNFANYCDAKYCVGVANGLDALTASLISLGVGEGDEVIVPAHTFVATWMAVSRVGATIVPVDLRAETLNIDVKQIVSKITDKTKAIIGVHLYGLLCDVEAIGEICKEHNLYFIEDAAQAHGASYKGKKAGSFGDIACFSFYPGKNLGAAGDGGAVVTNSEEVAKKVRQICNYGSEKKYYHDVIGMNSRLDEIHAAILDIKLGGLDEINNHRRMLAQIYNDELSGIDGIEVPKIPENYESVYHLYVIRASKRNGLQEFLSRCNIQTLIHYPVPCHKTDAYKEYNNFDFPATEKLCDEIISLPMGAHLSKQDILLICQKIKQYILE